MVFNWKISISWFVFKDSMVRLVTLEIRKYPFSTIQRRISIIIKEQEDLLFIFLSLLYPCCSVHSIFRAFSFLLCHLLFSKSLFFNVICCSSHEHINALSSFVILKYFIKISLKNIYWKKCPVYASWLNGNLSGIISLTNAIEEY